MQQTSAHFQYTFRLDAYWALAWSCMELRLLGALERNYSDDREGRLRPYSEKEFQRFWGMALYFRCR